MVSPNSISPAAISPPAAFEDSYVNCDRQKREITLRAFIWNFTAFKLFFARGLVASAALPPGSCSLYARGSSSMSELKIRAGDWIVVSDGRKALLLENEGDAVFPKLKTREVHEHQDAPNRLLNRDRPGRVQQSVANFRSSVEQTDRHDEAEDEFLLNLAERLAELVSSHPHKGLIVVAPPRALGVMRTAYTPALRSVIRAEIGRDLTHLPVYEIEQHLVG
jgi:protein required for attachment to host cells